jgi:two-component system, OmpR family, sensor kinase
MSKARLTRQEVGWLLAQEARGAASALRQGVSQLAVPEAPLRNEQGAPLVSTLNALDEAIALWAELDPATGTRGRRGRIDVAALLVEIAPHARIAIAPGEGTEVFGDETDLRRLLHVLVSRGARGGGDATVGDIDVRRHGDWIHVGVDLGPDLSASEDIERRWLSRMAMRFGGRVELVSSTETLILPADATSEHVEVEHLRRELQEAQELGESYARELARVFTDMQTAPRYPSSVPPRAQPAPLDLMTAMSAILVRSLKPLLVRARRVSAAGDTPASELATCLSDLADAGLALMVDLEAAAALPEDEPARSVDVQTGVDAAVRANAARASERGVSIDVRSPALSACVQPARLELLIRGLVAHAVLATPRGGRVIVEVDRDPRGVRIAVSDGGPPVPASAGPLVLAQHVDPMTFGRPGGAGLLIGRVVAEGLGGEIAIDESPEGATRVTAHIPASDAPAGTP